MSNRKVEKLQIDHPIYLSLGRTFHIQGGRSMFKPTLTPLGFSRLLAVFVGATLLAPIHSVLAESTPPSSSDSVHMASMSQPSPGWAEQLKGQTIVENFR
jgi:hypothetical protein